MLEKIIDGIVEQLNSTFGDNYKIYTEKEKQGLQTPCFFIQLINPISERIVKNRYSRENLFCVQYFPATNEPKSECYQKQDALFLALEYIMVKNDTETEDLQRGIKMRGEFVDGVLHFFVNYNMIVKKAEELTFMEELKVPDMRTKG